MSKRKEFMDKKWNYIQYDAVGHILYAQTKKETGVNFQNSVEQMIGLWKSGGEYKKNIVAQCYNAGLGSVENVIAYLLGGQKDSKLSKVKNALRYKEGLELSLQRLGVTLYSPSNQLKLL